MTATERRASGSLAFIFALRMLGLFLVLPVFTLEAAKYPGGDDPSRVGLAMGIYGLTQALLQIPLGLASDRLGRKRVIVSGLLVFILGSAIAAWAPSVDWLIVGRAVQGAGAISAAITALLSDLTRDAVRTKAMALVGVSIGAVFALSLVAAPALNGLLGLHGLLALMGVLALGAIGVVLWAVPPEPVHAQAGPLLPRLVEVLGNTALLRLNFGVFVLHAVQLAMWMAVPALLVQAGLAKAQHWHVYLPAVLASFVLIGGCLFRLERAGYLRAVFLVAVALIFCVQVGLAITSKAPTAIVLGALLVLFFCGFNALEASQPSLVSRLAPAHARGAALGVYNTLQSLGLFAGGAMGGWILKSASVPALFEICAGLMLAWMCVAWKMKVPG